MCAGVQEVSLGECSGDRGGDTECRATGYVKLQVAYTDARGTMRDGRVAEKYSHKKIPQSRLTGLQAVGTVGIGSLTLLPMSLSVHLFGLRR